MFPSGTTEAWSESHEGLFEPTMVALHAVFWVNEDRSVSLTIQRVPITEGMFKGAEGFPGGKLAAWVDHLQAPLQRQKGSPPPGLLLVY